MSLPRPVKNLLTQSPDASVVRTWARLQRTRRLGRPHHPAVLVFAVCTAMLVSGLITTLVRQRLERAPVLEAAPIAAAEPRLPSASTVLARGRLGASAKERTASQPLHVPTPEVPAAAPPPPADAVGMLLETASESVRAKRYSRAAALLSEVGDHHPEDPRASMALYALGRLQLDNLSLRAEAKHSFTRALELNPPEELVVPIWKSLEEASEPSTEVGK